MFFPEKIKSIHKGDRVLEIGPGGDPHPRADIFLERRFSEEEAFNQSGRSKPKPLSKEVVYYDGGAFPFRNKEFDYVICSHVLEHVDDVDFFLKELSRISKGGYLEFPLIYYDFVYNIPEHISFLYYNGSAILWRRKDQTGIAEFAPVQAFFLESMGKGYHHIIDQLKNNFFQGFEWVDEIKSQQAATIKELLPSKQTLLPFNINAWSDEYFIAPKRLEKDIYYLNLIQSKKVQMLLRAFDFAKRIKNHAVSIFK